MRTFSTIALLMGALGIGVAGAAGTLAGTSIQNTGYLDYLPEGGDPTTPPAPLCSDADPNTPDVCDPVVTTVLAKPDFQITPNDAGTPGAPDQDLPVPTAGYDLRDALAGNTYRFRYDVINTGNTPLLINLGTLGRSDTSVTNVRYLLDDGDGLFDAAKDTLLTDRDLDGDRDVTVRADDTATAADEGKLQVWQEYTLPAGAPGGTRYGASPSGTAKYDPNWTPADGVPAASATGTNVTVDSVRVVDNDNFNRVTTIPAAKLGSMDDPAGTGTGTRTYPEPGGSGSIVGATGDTQVINAKNDEEAQTPDSVVFVNTLRNDGSQSDSFALTVTSLVPNGVTVTFLDVSGGALPTDGSGRPVLSNVTPGTSVSFRVRVTYADPDGGTLPPTTIALVIGADSLGDDDTTPEDLTNDTVYTPRMEFGDSTIPQGTTPQPVIARTATPRDPTANRAYYPMDVHNGGGYDDTFALSGTVIIPRTDGLNPVPPTPVEYHTYTDVNSDGTFTPGVDTLGTLVTQLTVPAGTEGKVVGVVLVPDAAAFTTAPLPITQRATGAYSTIRRTDDNDTLDVGVTGKPTMVKSTLDTAAQPGDTITYRLRGTNDTNQNQYRFIVRDTVPANTTFAGVSATTNATGTVVYRVRSGGTVTRDWNTAAPTPADVRDGFTVDVALDTTGDHAITVTLSGTPARATGGDVVRPGEYLDVTFSVTVK